MTDVELVEAPRSAGNDNGPAPVGPGTVDVALPY